MGKKVYGIGNPLMDIVVEVDEKDIASLGIHKGAMNLIDDERLEELLAFVKEKEPTYGCGGSCPNTIITLASLGLKTTLAGKVGHDEYGLLYKKRLQELHVTDHIALHEMNTGSSIILITRDKERTMNTYLGANRYYSEEDLHLDELLESDFFHFTGYMWDTRSQQQAMMRALNHIDPKKTTVSFDIADPLAVSRNRDAFLHLISNYADVVYANSEEARILFNNYDPYECCKSMGKLCTTAVVKNGKLGSYISHNKEMFTVPVQGPVPPVDTTGAGDVYAAGFIYALAHDKPIQEVGTIASFLAGHIVQQWGAQFSKEKAASLAASLVKGEYQL
ncbi:MAG: adenosine kinase [Sphaerochaetaceae bacterium]|jgi:sugar/nucleoside kinase (ribokinase family)